MGILKKTVHVLSNICYIMITIYILIIAPRLFGYYPIVVLSGSMKPSYNIGTIAYYKSIKKNNIKVNDVITFHSNGKQIITHRVNKIIDSKFETKGDSNNSKDPNLVEYKDILGKVASITVPYLGYFISFVGKNNYLVIGAILILVLEFVFTNFDIDSRKE